MTPPFDIDVTDYLLGELDDASRAEADRRLATDPAFRAEVERLRPLVTRLDALPGEAWDPPAPPPLALPDAPRAVAAPRARRRVTLRMPALAAGLAAAALLAGGVGIGTLLDGGDPDAPRGERYALQPIDASGGGRAVAVVDAGTGTLRLDVSGLPPSAAGDFYELWLLNSPTDLVSVASFRVPRDGRATVTVPVPAAPDRYRFLDLSTEPADGNPAHSGRSVLRGSTA